MRKESFIMFFAMLDIEVSDKIGFLMPLPLVLAYLASHNKHKKSSKMGLSFQGLPFAYGSGMQMIGHELMTERENVPLCNCA